MASRAVREKCLDRALFGSAANVMHDPRVLAGAHRDAHMRQPGVQQPGQYVANFDGLGEASPAVGLSAAHNSAPARVQ